MTGIMGDQDNSQEEQIESVCELLGGATEEVQAESRATVISVGFGAVMVSGAQPHYRKINVISVNSASPVIS